MKFSCWPLIIAAGSAIGLLCPFSLWGQEKSLPENDKPVTASQVSDSKGKSKLPSQVQQLLKGQIIPAVESGRSDLVYQLLAPVIFKFSAEQFEELENFGKENELPSIRETFVEAHISAIEQGLATVQKLPLPITLYISGEVNRRLDQELLEMHRHAVFDSEPKLPKTWSERELLFWEIHVLRNRLLNLGKIAQYVSVIQQPHLKIALKKPDANSALIESLNQFNEAPEQVKRCLERLELNEAGYHLHQLPDALLTLEKHEDFEERLYAAFALQDSYASLDTYFKASHPEIQQSPALVAAKRDQTIETWYQAGKKAGVDVLDKSILLRVGAHWWLRGRYGMASECQGLLKPREAIVRPEVMFGLFMPKAPNKPVSRYLGEDDGIYGYDRRHFYSWAVEQRDRIVKRFDSGTKRETRHLGTRGSDFFW
jgi:hypothetical protein